MASVDVILLSEVYAAGEQKIVGADSRSLCRAIRLNGSIEPIFVDDIQNMTAEIINNAKDGDVVLCMGAGSISATPRSIVNAVQQANSLENKTNVSK
jgi:UDP-N-acetylmuramate--alanine ligase